MAKSLITLVCLITLAVVSYKKCSDDVASTNKAAPEDSKSEIDRSYTDAVGAAQDEYRNKLAYYIRNYADRIDVYELPDVIHYLDSDDLYIIDGESTEYIPLKVDDQFEVVPYGQGVHYKKKNSFYAKSLGELPEIVAKMIRSPESKSGGGVYRPTHGISVYSGNNIIFSTAISQTKPYFYVCYPGYPEENEFVTDYLSIEASSLDEFLGFINRHR